MISTRAACAGASYKKSILIFRTTVTKSTSNRDRSATEGFEARLERLRKIVDELERGNLPLEQAIERYEEGVGVLRSCAETLSGARLRVEELAKDAEGILEPRPARDLEAAAEDADDDE